MISIKPRYTFDDVLLVPQFSEIGSRSTIDISQNFLGCPLQIPILSAAMDTVTNARVAIDIRAEGGLGILHRFASYNQRLLDIIKVMRNLGSSVGFSIGINDTEGFEILQYLFIHSGVLPIVNIDVAHGDHANVVKTIQKLKNSYKGVKVLAGNVSTRSGYYRLAEAGADAIKVGIGGSAVCTTRIVTGHGVPTLASIVDCAEARDETGTKMIADGGIKSSGDICKALAAGADVVMLGTLLAGVQEAPGKKVEINGNVFKEFRGQSTVGSNKSLYASEGVSGYVPVTGTLTEVIKELVGGIKSGLSYSGANNLTEFAENAEFILVSPASVEESKARLDIIAHETGVPV